VKKIIALIILFITLSNIALCQDWSQNDDHIEWSEGEIILTNNDRLKGLVRFNTVNGVLAFDDGKTNRVFNARSVSSFTYFDAIQNQRRSFYSISYEDSKGIKRPQFFEVLKELKSLVLLSCTQPLDLKQKWGYDPFYSAGFNSNAYRTKAVASQKEIIYFLDKGENIIPYLVIDNQESLNTFTNNSKSRIKSKIVGEDYLKKFTGQHYKTLKEHAKNNNLHFDDKNELILILNFFDSLSE
jgi:hypothetical protein